MKDYNTSISPLLHRRSLAITTTRCYPFALFIALRPYYYIGIELSVTGFSTELFTYIISFYRAHTCQSQDWKHASDWVTQSVTQIHRTRPNHLYGFSICYIFISREIIMKHTLNLDYIQYSSAIYSIHTYVTILAFGQRVCINFLDKTLSYCFDKSFLLLRLCHTTIGLITVVITVLTHLPFRLSTPSSPLFIRFIWTNLTELKI